MAAEKRTSFEAPKGQRRKSGSSSGASALAPQGDHEVLQTGPQMIMALDA